MSKRCVLFVVLGLLLLTLIVGYFVRGSKELPVGVFDVIANPKSINDIRDTRNDVQYVYFVPGYLTKYSSQNEQIQLLSQVYPNAKVVDRKWNSWRTWATARNNADAEGLYFAEFLLDQHGSDAGVPLDKVVLVGHSLGGRIVVRTLSALAEKSAAVHHAVLLGAAINNDDPMVYYVGGYGKDFNKPAGGTIGRIISISNAYDIVLGKTYETVEEKPALGKAGAANKEAVVGILDIPVKFDSSIIALPEDTSQLLFEQDNPEVDSEIQELISSLERAYSANDTIEPMAFDAAHPDEPFVNPTDPERAIEIRDETIKLAEGLGLDTSKLMFEPIPEPLEQNPSDSDQEGLLVGAPSTLGAIRAAIVGYFNQTTHDSQQYIRMYKSEITKERFKP